MRYKVTICYRTAGSESKSVDTEHSPESVKRWVDEVSEVIGSGGCVTAGSVDSTTGALMIPVGNIIDITVVRV